MFAILGAALSGVALPASAAVAPGLYDGRTGRAVTLAEALGAVAPGHVLVVSEQHGVESHHVNQLAVLLALRARALTVSVGLEFLYYPDQPWVDRYVRGEVPEAEFLRAVRWGGTPFEWYRPLILFPVEAEGRTVALNAPPEVTRALARAGLEGLSDAERSLLPPGFQFGNERYYERFAAELGGGHTGEGALANLFAAQSAWDDTMAWRALEFLRAHPDQVLVIIVGDFHASYGGGLPDRMRARGAAHVTVISQVDGRGRSQAEIERLIAPDPRDGPRADFVWLTGTR